MHIAPPCRREDAHSHEVHRCFRLLGLTFLSCSYLKRVSLCKQLSDCRHPQTPAPGQLVACCCAELILLMHGTSQKLLGRAQTH